MHPIGDSTSMVIGKLTTNPYDQVSGKTGKDVPGATSEVPFPTSARAKAVEVPTQEQAGAKALQAPSGATPE